MVTDAASRLDFLGKLLWRNAVLPVVQLPNANVAVPLAETLLSCGLTAIEITFRSVAALEGIRAIRRVVPEMTIGAGTVLTLTQGRDAAEAGAAFLVTPGTNPELVEQLQAFAVPVIPGVATPSEIDANLRRGLHVMKFFPAEALGGPLFLSAIQGPFPAARFVPTGGISPKNLASYLALPNVIACGGTWIAPIATLEVNGYAQIAVAGIGAKQIVKQVRP